MSKTPSKRESTQFIANESECLSPSPIKDQPGILKTVFSHISNLHGFLKDWARMRDKGSRLWDCLSALKLHECHDDYYPSQLKALMANIVEILDSLKNIVEGVGILKTQMQALAQLQPSNSTVISTWPISKISESVGSIHDQLQKEYRLKCVITGMSLDEGRQSQRPYRYGMVLLCAGALINWLGLAEDYAEPVRYVGVACIVAGALLICAAMCCWLQSPARQPQADRADPDTHQIDDPIHVISMPDEETMQQKPPDYDTVAGAPPTYDDAIKLNPARLLPATSSTRHEPAYIPDTIIVPGQLDETPPTPITVAPVHRSQIPKTPPPPYNPTHAIR